MNLIITIYIWLLVLITFILFLPVITLLYVLTFLFDKRLVAVHFFSSWWAMLYIWLNPLWRMKVEGREKMKRKQTYVILANHQSLLDIAILYGLFFPYKWVTKVENFRIPGIGWIMILNRYIKVDRNKRETYMQMIADCERSIKKGSSVLLFPEGTRSRDGVIKNFKAGPFKVALQAKAPILPVIIDGSNRALKPNNFIFNGRLVFRVKILDPIPIEIFKDKDIKTIALDVQEIMVNTYDEIKNSDG
ncbi:MAG: 1-acyl-sn-glycerol-3-phosphate acyltransferase [Bacteroidales bacterium]|nr:1-acyl-sn-glycerol-3-phosphate acyltransferase [Bacteroidales bacterium]